MSELANGQPIERAAAIPAPNATLSGDLAIPEEPCALVILANGTGSTRGCPRHRAMGAALRERGFATLLLDLLTPAEESVDRTTAEHRFDIDLLATRLTSALTWASTDEATAALPVGVFAAGTGAAAALATASARPNDVKAIVALSGRPDLVKSLLHLVHAPTLLIVGGTDLSAIELNDLALDRLRCTKRLSIVPRATHLFAEPGAMDRVAELAREWLEQYVATGALQAPPEARSDIG